MCSEFSRTLSWNTGGGFTGPLLVLLTDPYLYSVQFEARIARVPGMCVDHSAGDEDSPIGDGRENVAVDDYSEKQSSR